MKCSPGEQQTGWKSTEFSESLILELRAVSIPPFKEREAGLETEMRLRWQSACLGSVSSPAQIRRGRVDL